ncbi:beta-lactamase-like protein [Xylariomycetidae sp. FL2044]|nr:beta-lactamase-like protein [Xylariomycetidae sp. FL2044]
MSILSRPGPCVSSKPSSPVTILSARPHLISPSLIAVASPVHHPPRRHFTFAYNHQTGKRVRPLNKRPVHTYGKQGTRKFTTSGPEQRSPVMSSKLIPSNPDDVAVIRNITPNVVTVSVPFARFGKVRVGGRGTIIRLTSGTLAVFSPVALTEGTKAKIAEMGGRVGYLIAGDMEHHIFLSEWKRAYPDAKLIGPRGLPEKRAGVKGDERIGHEEFAFVYDASNRADNRGPGEDFAADLEVEFVDAHPNKEIVLLYKPDRVLVQADLLFNLPAAEQYSRVPDAQRQGSGLLNRVFESVNSTQGEAKGLKRFLWYLLSSRDRPGFNASVQRIDGWDFDTIIPCHGETVESGGKALFRKVFEWHLQGHK